MIALGERLRSAQISEVYCELGDHASVVARVHSGSIFELQVVYDRCQGKVADCPLSRMPLDASAAEAYKGLLLLIPSVGYGEATVQEFTTYEKMVAEFASDLGDRLLFRTATDCFVPGLNSHRWRCLAGFSQPSGDVVRTVALVEILDGPPENLPYVVRQEFANRLAYRAAFDAFRLEVDQQVDRANEAKARAEQRQQRLDQMLQTIE